MKTTPTISSLLLGVALLSLGGLSHAQDQGLTRQQVAMDTKTFLAQYRWDDQMSAYVLKSGMALPMGVVSREEVIAMRDHFLSMNRWSEAAGLWEPVNGAPRVMSKLSREQVQMETARFLMTHHYDERTNEWISKMQAGR